MPAPKYLPHYTLADYQKWDGDWELWNGIPVAMTPSPFGRHQWLAGKILTQFNQQLEQQGCEDCYALGETDWIIGTDTIVRPDVAVVCGQFPERYIESPPRIVVEVLSDSTEHKDRTAKHDLYEANKVSYYLIVDPNVRLLTVYQLRDGHYDCLDRRPHYEFSLHDSCSLHLDPTRMFPNTD